MNYRTFPKLPNTPISSFGMGMMRLPTIQDGDQEMIDEDRTREMVETAIASGVNFFDTAYPYHNGQSEPMTGKLLEPYYDRIHVATKLPVWKVEKYEDFERFLDEQRERLKRDNIEFYLMHAVGDNWPKLRELGMLDFLDKAKADGKITHPCFSFHGTIDTFKEMIDSYDWLYSMMMFNYVDTHLQAGIDGMRYAYSKNVGVAVMEPLKGGMLVNLLPDQVADAFAQRELDVARTSMRYVYNQPEPTFVLSGVSNLEQLKQQIDFTMDNQPGCLTPAENEALKIAKSEFNLVPCSQCKYCIDCPKEIPIFDVISMYNYYQLTNQDRIKEKYAGLIEKGIDAAQCIECGACEDICPQGIKIIDVIAKAHQLLT